ncbi:hypothetical protein L3V86_02080 [Thiotrichales bacterium 19S11-10]|nr:hypothetical protein [Thiotrichales bacterium 19S11-10]
MGITVVNANSTKQKTEKEADQKQIILHFDSIYNESELDFFNKKFFITSDQLKHYIDQGYSINVILNPKGYAKTAKQSLQNHHLISYIDKIITPNSESSWKDALKEYCSNCNIHANQLTLLSNEQTLTDAGGELGFRTHLIKTNTNNKFCNNQLGVYSALQAITISDQAKQIEQLQSQLYALQHPQQQNSSDIKKEKPKEIVPLVNFNQTQKKKPAGGFSYTKDLNQH